MRWYDSKGAGQIIRLWLQLHYGERNFTERRLSKEVPEAAICELVARESQVEYLLMIR